MIRNLDEACRELRERWLIIAVTCLSWCGALVVNVTYHGWVFGLSVLAMTILVSYAARCLIDGREGAE